MFCIASVWQYVYAMQCSNYYCWIYHDITSYYFLFIFFSFCCSRCLMHRKLSGSETQPNATFRAKSQKLVPRNLKLFRSIKSIQNGCAQLMKFFHHVLDHKIMMIIVSEVTFFIRFLIWKIKIKWLFLIILILRDFRWAFVFQRGHIFRKLEESLF